MFVELPKDFKALKGCIGYRTMDTGDRFVSFASEDFKAAQEGFVVGFIIPAGVCQRHLDQVFGETRDLGGVSFVVIPRQAKRAKPEPSKRRKPA